MFGWLFGEAEGRCESQDNVIVIPSQPPEPQSRMADWEKYWQWERDEYKRNKENPPKEKYRIIMAPEGWCIEMMSLPWDYRTRRWWHEAPAPPIPNKPMNYWQWVSTDYKGYKTVAQARRILRGIVGGPHVYDEKGKPAA